MSCKRVFNTNLPFTSTNQHFTGNFLLCPGRLLDIIEFDKEATSRARHSSIEPGGLQGFCHLPDRRIRCQHDRLQVISPEQGIPPFLPKQRFWRSGNCLFFLRLTCLPISKDRNYYRLCVACQVGEEKIEAVGTPPYGR